MAKIRKLKKEVFEKIAAGEVVERPLSVVKELVENSIDAGSTSIVITLTEGGKKMIRVSDNGEGFDPDDIELAFQRHSTSKIQDIDDLDQLHTLGFRGEALPSILEVAKVRLFTADNDQGRGLICEFRGSEMVSRLNEALRQGTTVEVVDLFYNFPVRSKFLKSERSEFNQVHSFIQSLALVHYQISFELVHNGKTVFYYEMVPQLAERVYQVFGREFLHNLQPIKFENNGSRVSGFVSKINTGVPHRKHQYFFVNGRYVRERTLIAALNNTCQNYLEKSRSPIGILMLEVPPDSMDVNIHPMKLEVRFIESSSIFRLVRNAIESAYSGTTGPQAGNRFSRPDPVVERAHQGTGTAVSGTAPESATLFPGGAAQTREFDILGQYLNSYVIAQREDELLVIDQHNAQERILFDRLSVQYNQNRVSTAAPLFPIILDLSTAEISRIDEKRLKQLNTLGFEVEVMSGNSLDIKKYPQILHESQIKEVLITIIHTDEGETDVAGGILAELACKAAIKVNHSLNPQEMENLVTELFKTTNPHFCPHQRPIIITLNREEIEKRLKRR